MTVLLAKRLWTASLALFKLWSFSCVFILAVNRCPQWLWRFLFKRGASGLTLTERARAALEAVREGEKAHPFWRIDA